MTIVPVAFRLRYERFADLVGSELKTCERQIVELEIVPGSFVHLSPIHSLATTISIHAPARGATR